MANSSFAFWNFVEKFFSNIFDPWWIESADTEPTDSEGRLCSDTSPDAEVNLPAFKSDLHHLV